MQYVYVQMPQTLSVILAEGQSEQNFDPMPRSKQPPFEAIVDVGDETTHGDGIKKWVATLQLYIYNYII